MPKTHIGTPLIKFTDDYISNNMMCHLASHHTTVYQNMVLKGMNPEKNITVGTL